MSPVARSSRTIPLVVALVVGGLLGAGLLLLDAQRTGPTAPAALQISVDGLPPALARDLWLPPHGFTLQLDFAPPLEASARPALEVVLREERTGRTIAIEDRFVASAGGLAYAVPEDLGLRHGLVAVRARATFADGSTSEDWRRLRIRSPLGGPPIGERQIIHFDFRVDRDGDGRPDFPTDLERLGLVASNDAGLAQALADRIAERALARVERAFDDPGDPNRTGAERDPVALRFVLEASGTLVDQPHTTRICVGGHDPEHPGSLGHVAFDPRNARRASVECEGRAAGEGPRAVAAGTSARADAVDPQRAGLFPGELATYHESPLYREVFGPFQTAQGGSPLGSLAGDAVLVDALVDALVHPSDAASEALDEASKEISNEAPSANPETRAAQLARAIAILGDVLGTLLAHETGHALGLVTPGKPPYGLFGGSEGEDANHAVDPREAGASRPSLMQHGRHFRFEDLAGLGESGPLRFRAIDYAYLRDRLVLRDDRHTSL